MSKPLCISYCEKFGECGMDYDEDDLEEFDEDAPSSNDDGYCMDDGKDEGCDQFYPAPENE